VLPSSGSGYPGKRCERLTHQLCPRHDEFWIGAKCTWALARHRARLPPYEALVRLSPGQSRDYRLRVKAADCPGRVNSSAKETNADLRAVMVRTDSLIRPHAASSPSYTEWRFAPACYMVKLFQHPGIENVGGSCTACEVYILANFARSPLIPGTLSSRSAHHAFLLVTLLRFPRTRFPAAQADEPVARDRIAARSRRFACSALCAICGSM